jgi:perosamine synthetase
VPSLTYIATANAVRYVGAEPVFVDVDPNTWVIDPAAVEEAITPKTKGIVPVHLYGHPADMDAIRDIAERHGLWIVEDAAEAHGARYKGRPVGSLGTVATFSFYGNKIITSGEGGAITVDDPELERRLRLLRGQGMDPNRRYFFPVVGYNYRLTNLACALLCAQLERFDELAGARVWICDAYEAALADVPGISFQGTAEWAKPAKWLFCITVDQAAFGRSRDELATILDSQGIETRPFFQPLHRLPPYAETKGSRRPLPTTDRLGDEGMNLPTFSSMTAADIMRVVDAIQGARR